jgi:murein L,D-transpeptidase YafK
MNVWLACLLLWATPAMNLWSDDPYPGGPSPIPSDAPDRAEQALARVRPMLEPELTRLGLEWGDPVYLRAFKESAELELWMEPEPGQPFVLLRNYRIGAMSGKLGPKQAEGDGQTPEGFYEFGVGALHPKSKFHLAFNIGYPNAYDRAHGRTGAFLMVHGFKVSIGCYAMTNDSIEQIYALLAAAFARGQSSVAMHCFPFRITEQRLSEAVASPWHAFWTELLPAYKAFEATRRPPVIAVEGKHYVVR